MTTPPSEPQIEPMSRIQVLAAMGITAIVLLVVSKVWLLFDQVSLLPFSFTPLVLLTGLAVGLGISGASAIAYHFWPSYRSSAEFYMALVIQPLLLPDLLWLGLLPGLSEELLFRGVMLPAFGLNWAGIALSSFLFGVLHFSGTQQWSYVIWASVIGAILGFSAVESGNLLIPIVAHITTNLISSVSWKMRKVGKG